MSSQPSFDHDACPSQTLLLVREDAGHEVAELRFTASHLKYINSQLQQLEPQEILQWCITSLPGLFQTTAFGLTGLVIVDMLSKLDQPLEKEREKEKNKNKKKKAQVDLIFLDTLHHFQETYDLVERVRERYSIPIHTFTPMGCCGDDDNNNNNDKNNNSNAQAFSSAYGEKLWERDEERYDYVAKVEPAQRAYRQLHVQAVLTGRRRSQGGQRAQLDIVQVDDETGMVKVNPLANWSFAQVKAYVDANKVPYNALLDRGYKSVGDWHSTLPTADGEDERAGRWKGKGKTECGIHNPKSRYALYLLEQEAKERAEGLSSVLQQVSLHA